MKDALRVGVIVGRFQSPELHAGHRFLFRHVIARHETVLIVLGSARNPLNRKNPLNYETRKAMILSAYPNVRVVELNDYRHDEVWSKRLDELIAREFPGKLAVLYGSRKSFIPYYSGKHQCVTLKSKPNVSATKIRNNAEKIALASRQFRSGMIYAASLRPPLSYQAVDIAVIDYERMRVLLGHRDEELGALRFIGGFVDKNDTSLEMAAKREAFEETSGIEIDELRYLGSFRVDDWRYHDNHDGILTAFFIARYVFGAAKAADDLQGLAWVSIDSFMKNLVSEHVPLGEALTSYLTSHGLGKGR